MALVNALFSKADPVKRKSLAATLASRKYRHIVLDRVVSLCNEQSDTLIKKECMSKILMLGFLKINKKDRPSETNHELYVMQTLFLNLLEDRRQTAVDPQVVA